MIKSIVLSIKSPHALNIMDGYKTLELRKRVPKGFKGWVYPYITLAKPYLYQSRYNLNYFLKQYKMETIEPELRPELLNGTIPFRFWFDEYDLISYTQDFEEEVNGINMIEEKAYYITCGELKQSCLTYDELLKYGKGKDLYAWHIKKLEIFDKPMQVGDFIGTNNTTLTKAPATYQYVYLKGENK